MPNFKFFGATAFLSDEKIATEAFTFVNWRAPQATPEEKFFLMIDLIQNRYYHVVSAAIQSECRSLLGL